MKRVLWGLGGAIALFLLANIIVSGFTVIDYQWQCTRCLREYHVVEKRYYGITYSKTEKLEFAGHDLVEITGASCQHIYRKGGYGEESYNLLGVLMSDGITGEGNLFRPRWEALKAAFDLYQHVPNKGLMQETLSFIDAYLPADASVQDEREPRLTNGGYVMILAFYLQQAKSEQDWKKALANLKAEIAADKNV